MKIFWLCFLPLFVAVDAVGVLPMFLHFTGGMQKGKVRRVILISVVTAAIVALLFLTAGSALLKYLGITVADFMVAGGILLFIICMSDMLSTGKGNLAVDADSLGAVPLGVPLITGPGVLTTSILLMNEYGFGPTAGAIVLNVLLAGGVFSLAPAINRLLGKTGAMIISKISNLLLAAIAVMMIRKGLTIIIGAWGRGL
jgi:multiple antibiotic resistance protein